VTVGRVCGSLRLRASQGQHFFHLAEHCAYEPGFGPSETSAGNPRGGGSRSKMLRLRDYQGIIPTFASVHRDWAHPRPHLSAPGMLTPSTAAPGLFSPPPTSAPGLNPPLQLRWDRARRCNICAGTGPTPATSAPGLTGLSQGRSTCPAPKTSSTTTRARCSGGSCCKAGCNALCCARARAGSARRGLCAAGRARLRTRARHRCLARGSVRVASVPRSLPRARPPARVRVRR
jgi:hypothetical protein